MKVRLQQPSGRELAPFNPIRPPAAITQVLLLANPLKVGLLCLVAEFSLCTLMKFFLHANQRMSVV